MKDLLYNLTLRPIIWAVLIFTIPIWIALDHHRDPDAETLGSLRFLAILTGAFVAWRCWP